jgi:hypothetical protein
MKRFLRFAGVFLGVILLVYLLVFGANFPVFRTLYDNRDAMADGSEWVANTFSLAGLAEYIAANPAQASVLVAEGDQVIVDYGADIRRPMGSLHHLFLLLALDDAISEGRISLQDRVDASAVRAYHVAGVEERRLGERLSALGETPELWRLVDLMIRTGHWWIGDYLFERLGSETVNAKIASVSGGYVDGYRTWSGLFRDFDAASGFRAERALYDTFPKGSPRGLLAGLDAASPRVLEWLAWPMENAAIRKDMTAYHALYESRMSILNGLSIGTSAYTGIRIRQVVMLTDIPTGLWFHFSANFMNQDFQQRLVYDPALQEKVSAL